MQLVNRHKGVYAWRTTVTGRDGHSSATHRGVNAIDAAAEIIGWLQRQAETWRRDGPFDDSFDPPYATSNVGADRRRHGRQHHRPGMRLRMGDPADSRRRRR